MVRHCQFEGKQIHWYLLKLELIFGQVDWINNSECVRSFNLSIGLLLILSDTSSAHLANDWMETTKEKSGRFTQKLHASFDDNDLVYFSHNKTIAVRYVKMKKIAFRSNWNIIIIIEKIGTNRRFDQCGTEQWRRIRFIIQNRCIYLFTVLKLLSSDYNTLILCVFVCGK